MQAAGGRMQEAAVVPGGVSATAGIRQQDWKGMCGTLAIGQGCGANGFKRRSGSKVPPPSG